MKKVISIGVFVLALVLGTLATRAQVIVDGNPSCATLGIGSATNYRIQPVLSGVNTYTISGIGDVTVNVNTAPTNATPSSVSFNATAPFVRAFIVKAGNRANIYYYDPAVLAGINLLSPIDTNGNFPGLSHLDVCYNIGTTAAHVNITGRVLTAGGNPIVGASVSTTLADGTLVAVRSNTFGFYTFSNLEVGHIYILNTRAKGYTFNPNLVNLMDEVTNNDIIAN